MCLSPTQKNSQLFNYQQFVNMISFCNFCQYNYSIIVTQMTENNLIIPQMTKSNLKSSNIVSSSIRKGGHRLEHEIIGTKHLFHNYGYGHDEAIMGFASGETVTKMLSIWSDTKEVHQCAVLGAGVSAYFTALYLMKSGQRVTIYNDCFYQLKKSTQPSLIPKIFMPNQYDWSSDMLKHELITKISYEYLKQSVRVSRYQGVRGIIAHDLIQSKEQLKEVVSQYVYDTFKEGTLRFQGGKTEKSVSYTTILIDSPFFIQELRVEAVLRGIKFVKKNISSCEQALKLKENYIFNCRDDLFQAKNMEKKNNCVLEFDVQHPQENQYTLLFKQNQTIYEIFSLRKKTYLVGPALSKDITEATNQAVKTAAQFVKHHSLTPSL